MYNKYGDTMKKVIIIVMLCALICTGCFEKNNDNIEKEETYDESYIEVIPEEAKDFIVNLNDEVILNYNQIQNYNQKIKSKTNTIYDLNNISNVTKEEILNYINYYKIPTLPKYDGEKEIDDSTVNEILQNRNIDAISNSNNIQKGIIINRSNLRSFPTDTHFYDEKNTKDVDNLQESELHINMPVLILHESKDKKWLFVLTYFYYGWVKSDDVAYAKDEDWEYFINNSSFGIITDYEIKIGDTTLDMSVKLPYEGINERGYKFSLPIKGDNNFVDKSTIIVSMDKAHLGYLPYTKRNIYIQAFKYYNSDYSWGGMDSGVDCSSYVANVYRTFGFELPRNTSSQKDSVGDVVSLSGKTLQEKKKMLSDMDYPSLVYMPGHVMIYLGLKDGKDYIIHASGSDGKVVLTELDLSSRYLTSIDRLVLIK